MRRDDLLFIVLGVLPGAVVLGRVGYGLLHADWYAPDWRQLLDPSTGSVELTGAVAGGRSPGSTWPRCWTRRSRAGSTWRSGRCC